MINDKLCGQVSFSEYCENSREISLTSLLRFLQHFAPNINRHLVELWSSRIPLLVHYLQQNTDTDRAQWHDWLCSFTKDSVSQIGKKIF